MKYILMHQDIEVLKFDLDNVYIEVINNDFLPLELRDYIKTTKYESAEDVINNTKYITVLKDYLSDRTINLSRENAKIILNVCALPQSLKTDEKLKIVFACKGLNMSDCVWIKKENESKTFNEVNLRKNKLSDASYEIAILGKMISATSEDLQPDLSTKGMFAKMWKRVNDTVCLWKTDKTTNFVNTISEVCATNLLKHSNVNVLRYALKEQDDYKFSVCPCIADDNVSLISAQSMIDYCNHTHKDFKKIIEDNFKEDFAKMCVSDYLVANTDRHNDNWGFIMDNKTGQIISIAPLYDYNFALVADYMDTNIDELKYEPTNMYFYDTIINYVKDSNFKLDAKYLKFVPEQIRDKIQKRLDFINEMANSSRNILKSKLPKKEHNTNKVINLPK